MRINPWLNNSSVLYLNLYLLILKVQNKYELEIRKYGAEEFCEKVEDDMEKVEYQLENTLRVLDELACSPNGYVVLLLEEEAYQWWNTLPAVVLKDRLSQDFFRTEFIKKYGSERYHDKKQKEFFELKQCHRTIAEYERESIQFSKYVRELIPPEVAMCTCFKEGLNEEVQLFVGALELKDFVVLVDKAQKIEDILVKRRKKLIWKLETRVNNNWEKHSPLPQRK